jgi:hypothetical protein
MNAPLRLSAMQRGKLRKAIVRAPNWKAVRQEHGFSIETMNPDQLLTAASLLSLDIMQITGEQPQEKPDMNAHHKPRPHEPEEVLALAQRLEAIRDKTSANDAQFIADVLKTISEKQEGRATDSQFYTLLRIANKYEAPPPAKPQEQPRAETPEQLEKEIAALETSVKQENDARRAANRPGVYHDAGDAGAQLAALIAQLAGQSVNPEQVARIVDERISAALERVPSIRIEIAAPNGEIREVAGHQHPQFKTLLRAASSRMANGYPPSIWLAGPAGSGKTHAGHQLADALVLPFHLNGALSMPHELLGFIDAGGTYHRTPFREAYEHGGVYMFDEVDGSDNSALLALNAALANGHATFPDAKIKRHENCIILASANTWGLGATAEYVGRAKIDAAFLSRFPVRIAWDYDVALEVAISGNEKFARRVIAARERARAAGLKVLIDPRASQAGAALIAAGMSEDEAAAVTYLANVTPEQRKQVEDR